MTHWDAVAVSVRSVSIALAGDSVCERPRFITVRKVKQGSFGTGPAFANKWRRRIRMIKKKVRKIWHREL